MVRPYEDLPSTASEIIGCARSPLSQVNAYTPTFPDLDFWNGQAYV